MAEFIVMGIDKIRGSNSGRQTSASKTLFRIQTSKTIYRQILDPKHHSTSATMSNRNMFDILAVSEGEKKLAVKPASKPTLNSIIHDPEMPLEDFETVAKKEKRDTAAPKGPTKALESITDQDTSSKESSDNTYHLSHANEIDDYAADDGPSERFALYASGDNRRPKSKGGKWTSGGKKAPKGGKREASGSSGF